MALLPPIPLYRRLFRTHRKFLPKEERLLGDEYIKSEFRAHQKIENPMHIVCFPFLHSCYRVITAGVITDSPPDRVLDRMADVCSEGRGKLLARREDR